MRARRGFTYVGLLRVVALAGVALAARPRRLRRGPREPHQ
jgi:hypothetical protein